MTHNMGCVCVCTADGSNMVHAGTRGLKASSMIAGITYGGPRQGDTMHNMGCVCTAEWLGNGARTRGLDGSSIFSGMQRLKWRTVAGGHTPNIRTRHVALK
jgi:hypothetical protein